MKTTIEVRHQSIIVIPGDPSVTLVLKKLEDTLRIENTFVDSRGNVHTTPGKSFAAGNRFDNEFIFNINFKTNVYRELLGMGLGSSDINITTNKHIFTRAKLKYASIFEDKDYQTKFIDVITRTKFNTLLIDLQTGKGKALCDSTLLATPGGVIEIGNVVTGTKLLDDANNVCEVTEVFKDRLQMYTLHFYEIKDTIECCLDHQWLCYDKDGINMVVLTLSDILIRVNNSEIMQIVRRGFKGKLTITGITKTTIKESTCVSVTGDSLFRLENGAISHNTHIANKAIFNRGGRFACFIPPKFIAKWVGDIEKYYPDEDLIVIQGGESLRELMVKVENSEVIPNIIIFSNVTIQLYIKEYEQTFLSDAFTYAIEPKNLMQELNIPTLLIDEVHMAFYNSFITTLYFDVELVLGLSATLISLDHHTDQMYKLLFPKDSRLDFLAFDRYNIAIGVRYRLSDTKNIRVLSGRMYNHNIYEQSIRFNRTLLENYISMLMTYIEKTFIKIRLKDEKAIIFFASKMMCELMRNRLRVKYKDLRIEKYVQGDPYDNIINGHITCTTTGSAGAAIDIPDLIRVYQTVSIMSPQVNLQVPGRLRKIHGRDTKIYCFYAENIKKHVAYATFKRELYTPKMKKIFYESYGTLQV